MCDSLVICVEADTNHKSARFFHTFCHKMHDFTKTMLSIGRHIPLIFCVRKFPIHYRLNDQIGKILFDIFEKMLGGGNNFLG